LQLRAEGMMSKAWSGSLPALAAKPKIITDVPYAGAGSDPLQALDIIPSARSCKGGGCPVLLFVHGGGWQRGDKGRTTGVGKAYAAAGIVFVNVNYRLSPAVKHPAHVEDVAAAIAWVRDNIASHGGDPRRIVLMGHSAGAHLVALVVTDPQYLAAHGMAPGQIAGVIPVDTATYDLIFFERDEARAEKLSEDRGGLPFKQTAFADSPEAWKAASPLHTVRKGVGYPPFLIIYASSRIGTAVRESKRFADTLRAAGTAVDTLGIDDRNHKTILLNQAKATDSATKAVVAFINRQKPR